VKLAELAWLFLRLGATAFGGPAAHIALMEDEVVRRRAWLSREEFLDLVGACNLIPGPNSTELAIHIGHRRGGWPGLLIAGLCFITPAMLIVGAIAWAYVRFGKLPAAGGLLWGLVRTAVKSVWLAGVGIAAAAATVLGAHELLVLLAAGMVMLGMAALRTPKQGVGVFIPLIGSLEISTIAAPPELPSVFLFFLKVGSVLFGSGYVLLAFLRADLVERWHWLSEAQLLDAIAVGQLTPGPVFTTATFIGYLIGGFAGAGVATAGIFLPAFVFVALSAPLVPRLRRSPLAGAFLDGINVASLALMAVVSWFLGRSAITTWWSAALALVSAVLLIRFRVNSAWLVLGGALVGLIVT
jgi:chromate transporter